MDTYAFYDNVHTVALNNLQQDLLINKDGSVDLYFGPKAPAGKESNWIQTVPGKGWFTILRLYSPTEAWFDKTWQPGEIERLEDIPPVAPSNEQPAMGTDIPTSITTPDR